MGGRWGLDCLRGEGFISVYHRLILVDILLRDRSFACSRPPQSKAERTLPWHQPDGLQAPIPAPRLSGAVQPRLLYPLHCLSLFVECGVTGRHPLFLCWESRFAECHHCVDHVTPASDGLSVDQRCPPLSPQNPRVPWVKWTSGILCPPEKWAHWHASNVCYTL